MSEFVSVKDHGAVGDGVTNDKTAIESALQSAINAGKGLFFPEGTYLFDNVKIDHDIHIHGHNCIFRPEYRDVAADQSIISNQSKTMFTVNSDTDPNTHCDYIKISGISVVGRMPKTGSSQPNRKGSATLSTDSIFVFDGVSKVEIENCSFSMLDGSYQDTPDDWADRRAVTMSFIDCADVDIDHCTFSQIFGDEWIWRIYQSDSYSDGITKIANCTFEDNALPIGYDEALEDDKNTENIDESTNGVRKGLSCAGIIGGQIYFENNVISNIDYYGSAVNLCGTYVYIKDNYGYNLKVQSVFDTCETSYCKNEYVECSNNHIENTQGLIGLHVNTKDLLVKDNYFICRNAVQTRLCADPQVLIDQGSPVDENDPKDHEDNLNYAWTETRYAYDSVRIINNEFYDYSTCAWGDVLVYNYPLIMINRVGSEHTKQSSTRSAKLYEIKNNVFESIRSDCYQPIKMMIMAKVCNITNNTFKSIGQGTSALVGYIMSKTTDLEEGMITIADNVFRNNNYSSFPQYTVAYYPQDGIKSHCYFRNNTTDVKDGNSVALKKTYNTTNVTSHDNFGFLS